VPAPPAPPVRDADLVLAGLHLRLGSLVLARAELETIGSLGGLDRAGRVDLAEVRWRTGDLVGAGQAAGEVLAGGEESVIALVVAAEAASALGRPSEARRLAGQAQARMDGPIDPVFAGMPRSGVWPADPAEPVPSPTTLFPPDRVATSAAAEMVAATTTAAAVAAADVAAAAAEGTGGVGGPGRSTDGASAAGGVYGRTAIVATDAEPGFWDLPPVDPKPSEVADTGSAATPAEPTRPTGLDPAAVLDAGEAALAAGDYTSAALHLGLAVRVTPSIAPVILEAIGDIPDAGLQMVRGDAYRAVGRETDARRAYEAAMAASGSAVTIAPPAAPIAEPPTPQLDVPPDDPDDDSDPFAGEP